MVLLKIFSMIFTITTSAIVDFVTALGLLAERGLNAIMIKLNIGQVLVANSKLFLKNLT